MAAQTSLLSLLGRGDLVKVPLRSGGYYVSTAGTSTAVESNSVFSDEGGIGLILNLTANPGITQGASARTQLYGPVVGVRFRRSSSATAAPFGLVVDGVAYHVDDVNGRRDNTLASSMTDGEALFIVAEDLGQGPHTVEFILPSDPYGGTTRNIILYGWLAASSAGYERKPRIGAFSQSPASLTTTAASILTSVYTEPRGVRKLCFYNNDTVARTAIIMQGSQALRPLALAAGSDGKTPTAYAEHDFGENVTASVLKWKAGEGDTTSPVKAWWQGDY